MKVGDLCYITVSNYRLEEVVIRKIAGNLYTVKFINSNKVIRVPGHRLYASKEEAALSIPEENSIYTNRPPGLH